MRYRVVELEGIAAHEADALVKAGIETSDDLLQRCGDPKGRRTTAATCGVDEKRLLQWLNMADLMRISGVGKEFSELLEAAGVDTVKELQHRKPENLAARMVEVNAQKKLCGRTPTEAEVAKWIDQAKLLTPLVSY